MWGWLPGILLPPRADSPANINIGPIAVWGLGRNLTSSKRLKVCGGEARLKCLRYANVLLTSLLFPILPRCLGKRKAVAAAREVPRPEKTSFSHWRHGCFGSFLVSLVSSPPLLYRFKVCANSDSKNVFTNDRLQSRKSHWKDLSFPHSALKRLLFLAGRTHTHHILFSF